MDAIAQLKARYRVLLNRTPSIEYYKHHYAEKHYRDNSILIEEIPALETAKGLFFAVLGSSGWNRECRLRQTHIESIKEALPWLKEDIPEYEKWKKFAEVLDVPESAAAVFYLLRELAEHATWRNMTALADPMPTPSKRRRPPPPFVAPVPDDEIPF